MSNGTLVQRLPVAAVAAPSPSPSWRVTVALGLIVACAAVTTVVQVTVVLPESRAVAEQMRADRDAAVGRQVEEARRQKLLDAAHKRQVTNAASLLLQSEDNLRLAKELAKQLRETRGD